MNGHSYFENKNAELKPQEIWREKVLLMQKFTRLTQELKSALDAKNVDKFEKIIQRREQIIAALDALDNPSAEGGEEIRQLESQWFHLLKQAWEINQSINVNLNRDQRELLHDMGMLRTAQQADQTYLRQTRQVEGYFIDKKK